MNFGKKYRMTGTEEGGVSPMRSLLSLCFSVRSVLASTFVFVSIIAGAEARIVFDETSIDFGAFSADSIRVHTFRFRNAGDVPLTIMRTFSDCGCTVAHYRHDPILPDSTGIVTVRFDGRGRRPGSFIKRVRVSSNDPDSPLYLYIRGSVK